MSEPSYADRLAALTRQLEARRLPESLVLAIRTSAMLPEREMQLATRRWLETQPADVRQQFAAFLAGVKIRDDAERADFDAAWLRFGDEYDREWARELTALGWPITRIAGLFSAVYSAEVDPEWIREWLTPVRAP